MFMLRRSRIAIAIAALVAAASVALLADASSGGATVASTGVKAATFKFVVLTVGSKTDGSFGNSWYAATENAIRKTGAEGQWVGGLLSPDQYFSQGSSYATAGYDLVIVAHGGMEQVASKLAEQFPTTQFCVAPIPAPTPGARPSNLCIFDAEQQVGAFRSGLLAGLITRSNVVASNVAYQFPALTRQVEAFQLGARCVNPKVKVLNVVTNSDADASVTLTASQGQIRRGADVLMGATGTAMAGVFQAAKGKPGTYAIGQYVDSTAVAPNVIIASNIPNFQDVLPLVVKQAMSGGLPKAWFKTFGLKSSVRVGYLAYNKKLYGRLPASVRAANERVQQRYTEGKIKLPSTAVIGTPGAAAKIKVKSMGCNPSKGG